MRITKTNPQQTILRAVEKYVDFISPTYGPAGKKLLKTNSIMKPWMMVDVLQNLLN